MTRKVLKTFAELGMTFTEDPECSTCQEGRCHNRATSTKDGIEYSIHVSMYQNSCSDTCDDPIIEIDVSSDSNTFTGNELNKTFKTEFEAVDYLQTTFEDFKCFPV